MKISRLKERLNPDRPMTTISIRMPGDVIEDLKRIAPQLGFSGYQPLVRAYVGQGLRAEFERLEGNPQLADMIESLRRQGIDEVVIHKAIEDSQRVAAWEHSGHHESFRWPIFRVRDHSICFS